MKNLFAWCKENILFILTLVLLAFIPLYPKLPLVDIKHTWVYVRVEDFLVLIILCYWGYLIAQKKITLHTPLTLSFLIFWIIGAVATIHGILLIVPSIDNFDPTVALLSYFRRIEYMSVFFIAYASIKKIKYFSTILLVIIATFFVVVLYGIGQKYVGFPAFLTMNEEFAKGIPIRLSSLSRVSSTFGGHYDLAAYIVLVLPIIVSLLFVIDGIGKKVILMTGALLGFIVLFMTVSRISFVALLLSLGGVLLLQKRKLFIISFATIALISLLLILIIPSLFDRFGHTLQEVHVVIDTKTGAPIGHINILPREYFTNKIVKQHYSRSIVDFESFASPSASLLVPIATLPDHVDLLVEPNAPNGEDLPQGTGYVNISLLPIERKLSYFLFQPKTKEATTGATVFFINGDYLLKKVLAYDLSFTTRFQGQWPRAIRAFQKNIFLGSGYGSVGMAVDNSYLRMLSEVGIFGFGAYMMIFFILGIYIWKIFPDIESPFVKSFIIGLSAGIAGLMLNAFFIDVFEASKVAFTLWLFVGIAFGLLRDYQRKNINLSTELIRVISSDKAIFIYMCIASIFLFFPIIQNNFVADDFTWLRWAEQCGKTASTLGVCFRHVPSLQDQLFSIHGFFYQPAMKAYVLLMYKAFFLNQSAYHAVSILVNGISSGLVYLLAIKVFRNRMESVCTAVLFLALTGYSESVYWISASSILFMTCFSLLSLIFYIRWKEQNRSVFYLFSIGCFIISVLFHFSGIITPLLFVLYTWVFQSKNKEDRQILFFGLVFSFIAYLPYIRYIGIAFICIILFKHVYRILLPSGRAIAIATLVFVVCVFSLFQIIQNKRINSQWYTAGERVRNIFIALHRSYGTTWSHDDIEFHFVHVPRYIGSARIFSDGLKDALWLLLRNDRAKVYTWNSLSQAFDAIPTGTDSHKVFEFYDNSTFVEQKKTQ